MFFAAPLLLAPLAWAATPKHLEQRQSDCSAVHIFLAKGNNEPYPGRQGTLVNAICSGLASCDYENILYYNPVEAPYCDSINEGVANGIAQITAYNKRCPDAKLVISGYSQGAQIVSDLLAGGGGNFFQGCLETTTAPLDINSAPGNKIAAALVFGNTRHTANQPYNVLSGAGADGVFPRTGAQASALLQYTSVFHDYCVSTDPICAGGGDVATHLNYFDLFTDEAAAWVKSQLLAASSVPSTTSATSVAAPTKPNNAVTPYPTMSFSNGTISTPVSIPVIPTVTTTFIVTVPCASVNTVGLSALSTFPISAAATTTATPVIYTSTTSAAKNVTQPTQVVFTGGASSAVFSAGMLSFAVVAALLGSM